MKVAFAAFLLAVGAAAAAAAQDFDELTIERVAMGHRFLEAPIWSPEGRLLFADVPENLVLQWKPGEKPAVIARDTNGAGGLGYDAQGRLYLCEWHSRRVVRVDKKGKRETLAEKWEGKRLNSPNDLVIRRDGHVWFTDPAFGSAVEERDLDFYGIYHLTPKGDLELAAKWTTRPNGIALSPNGRLLYVSNSDERTLYVFDVDHKTNALTNPRVLIRDIPGVPGGVRTDEKGNLYIAARHVLIYSPEAKLLRRVEMSEPVSNLTFGEADLSSLFVTTRTQLYRIRVPIKGHLIYPPVPPSSPSSSSQP